MNLPFRYYDAKKKVMGKTMAEQLRFAMCWWHTTCWPGSDPFGGDTLMRPWHHSNDEMGAARTKADVMFDAMNLTQIDYFAFHDRDIAPEGASLERIERQRDCDGQLYRKEDGQVEKEAAVGHGQCVFQPPLHGGCCNKSRP